MFQPLRTDHLKSWWMAARPKTLTAAIVPVLVASSLVYAETATLILWVSLFALFSAIFIQVGTNFVNDAIDFKKGADTETRLGPQRVTQSGLFTGRQVLWMALFFFLLAFLLGVPLVYQGGWPIVIIGLVSLFLGYSYTAGPFPLAYLGLGDLFVVLFFGVIAVGGVYFLQTETWSLGAFVAGLQIGFLGTVLIVINNIRDCEQDKLVNKKTLAVRMGLKFSRVEVLLLLALSFLLCIYWIWQSYWGAGVLPLLLWPRAQNLILKINRTPPSPVYNDFLVQAAKLQLLFGVLLSLGFILQPWLSLWVRKGLL